MTELRIYPRTMNDGYEIQQIIDAEHDAFEGFFLIEAEEEHLDELEMEIDELLLDSEISYRIEGIF